MNPNNKDYEIEMFWYDFKKSMILYYKNKLINRPIDLWSNNLNLLQSEKKYEEIELSIRNYISLYGIDLLRGRNDYEIGILLTNIKRWNNLTNKYNFESSNIKYHNIIFLLLDIFQILLYKNDNEIDKLFGEIELYIIYHNFEPLIDYSIKYNKASILDKLNNFVNINKYIENKYKIKLAKEISGIKILKKINNITL